MVSDRFKLLVRGEGGARGGGPAEAELALEMWMRKGFAEVDALYVLQTLEVDEELQPEKIHRTLTVKGDELHVYDAFHFEATEIRLLRAAVSSFYDMSVLTARTLLEFKE
ncbi:CTAG/Pcc1 family [Phytophthora cactorum]|nr:CTAG/Pcc1 family [Phytophthora cactorum]